MKSFKRIIAMGALGWAALSAAPGVLADDLDDCRGGYRILLMTPAECNTFLRQLDAVRARGDRLAELDLREWHTALLIQRAEACPCRAGEPVVLVRSSAGPKPGRRTLQF